MGASASRTAISNSLDTLYKAPTGKKLKESKVLIFGPDEISKSAIFTRLKIMHQGSYTPSELLRLRSVIYDNVLDYAKAVINFMRELNISSSDPFIHVFSDRVLSYRLDSRGELDLEVAHAIHEIWKDPLVSMVIQDESRSLNLPKSASYFLDAVLRIGSPGYLPTEIDIIHVQQKNLGILDTRFEVYPLRLHLINVGHQSCNWIKAFNFEGLTSIVYFTDLSDYDRVIPGRHSRTLLTQSILDFEEVVNLRCLSGASIIVIFTHVDRFRQKLKRVPLRKHFPDYEGNVNPKKAEKYILDRFVEVNRTRSTIYPHFTNDVSSHIESCGKLLLDAIGDTISRKALKSVMSDGFL